MCLRVCVCTRSLAHNPLAHNPLAHNPLAQGHQRATHLHELNGVLGFLPGIPDMGGQG